MTIIAKGPRVYLRKITKKDAPFLFDLMNQKSCLIFIGDRGIASIADAEEYILNGPLHSYKIHGFGLYMVVDTSSQESIGMCGFLKRPYLDCPDLGYAISERYYQQGFGFEAADIAMQVANTLIEAKLIYASVKEDNVGSCRLLCKLGFTLVETTSLNILGSNADDLLLYKKDIA